MFAFSANGEATYWLGTMQGTDYVFETQAPTSLATALETADSNRYQVDKNSKAFAATAQQTPYSFISASVKSDMEMFDNRLPDRSVSMIAKNGGAGGDDSWITMNTSEPGVEVLANMIPPREPGKWFDHQLILLKSPDGSKPSLKVSIFGDGERYWMGRRVGDSFTFDVPLPQEFVENFLSADPNTNQVDKNPREYPSITDGGTECHFITASLTYDKGMFDQGKVAIAYKTDYRNNIWISRLKDSPKGGPLNAHLPQPSGSAWENVEMVIMKTATSATPMTTLPIPPSSLAVLNMKELGKTMKAGAYFSSVKAPADLDGFRKEMLDYGNAGRRDPDFRKIHGSQTATDLSGDKVDVYVDKRFSDRRHFESVFKQNSTPPYFADHVLNKELNDAAQFQAEYQASIRSVTHDGPRSYQGQSMFNTVDRAKFFNSPGFAEACGGGSPGLYPMGWMSSETHFRPWFNIGGAFWQIGYGAAQSDDGGWYYTAVVSGEEPPVSAIPVPVVTAQPSAPATPEANPAPAATGSAGNENEDYFKSLLLGRFVRLPMLNNWHEVTLMKDEHGNLFWTNAAGVSWPLEFTSHGDPLICDTGTSYGKLNVDVKLGIFGEVTGYVVNGDTYLRVNDDVLANALVGSYERQPF